VRAAATARSLLVGDPYAVARAGSSGTEGEVVGGGGGDDVVQLASELCVCDGLLNCTEIEGAGRRH